MPEDTKAKADTTSTDEGKNSEEGKAEGAGSQTAKTDDAPKFTQADLDRVAAKTREEEREKARKAKEKEDRERNEAKAKEQGEFQTLAEGYKKDLDELKPKHEAVSAELADYRTKVAEMVRADLKALPDEVKAMSPAKYGDDKTLTNPLDVLAWLPQAKALAAKLDGAPAKPGAREDPKPKGGGSDPEVEKRAKTAQANSTRNTF